MRLLALLVLLVLIASVLAALAALARLAANRHTRSNLLAAVGAPAALLLLGVALFGQWTYSSGVTETRVRVPAFASVTVKELSGSAVFKTSKPEVGSPIPASAERTPESAERIPRSVKSIPAPAQPTKTDDVPSKSTLRIVLHALLKAVDEMPESVRRSGGVVPATVSASASAPAAAPASTPVPQTTAAPVRAATAPPGPAWIGLPPHRGDNGYQMAIVTDYYSSQAECETHLSEEIQKAVDQYAGEVMGRSLHSQVHLPADCLGEDLIRETWPEVKQFSVGPMVRLHALLVFDHNAKQQVQASWDEAFVERRIRALGGLGAVLLMVLAMIWGYLRLDLATAGRHRGWLRAAIVVALLAMLAAVMR